MSLVPAVDPKFRSYRALINWHYSKFTYLAEVHHLAGLVLMDLVVDVLAGKNRRHVVYFGGVGL